VVGEICPAFAAASLVLELTKSLNSFKLTSLVKN